ncbi:MAG: MFS transporter [Candidatus Izemoplasmatales bacterium]|jgi:MFS family permease|nr:MFS transporter [Candidatus Izemoplasmatales bacterium]
MTQLWNKNFTILTIGSFISALGSAAAGISFSVLIFIETQSPLLLAIFTIANIIPRLISNFVVGPFVDRHSRVKMIYLIDFFYSVIFAIIAIILFTGFFNVWAFMAVAGFIGVIDTLYQTAFMSLFPEVIPKGRHSQAYSISSLIWPISAAIMAPVAMLFIDKFVYGVAILMVFNAVTFVVTATMETMIHAEEKLNTSPVIRFQFVSDLKEGLDYFKKEKGILGIGLLFMVFSFVYSVSDLLKMPYFQQSSVYTLVNFSFLISAGAIGRVVGGLFHYFVKLPTHSKFKIAVVVYFTVEILNAVMLFTPYFMMIIFSFIIGALSVTSFNIRMAATQTYIPSEKRGRVNSVQNLLWNMGAIIGTVIIGLVAEYTDLSYRVIILGVAVFSISAIFLIPIRSKQEFMKIYNVEV